MAGSVNKVILIGRLGQEPQLNHTQGGNVPTMTLSLATDEGYKDRNSGQRVEKTEWHRVVPWRQQAEFAARYGYKGQLVCVEGKLQTRKWQDQNGQDRYSTEVVAQHIQLLSRRDDNSQAGQPEQGQPGQQGGQW